MKLLQYIEILIENETKHLAFTKSPFLMKGELGLAVFLYYIYVKTQDIRYLDKVKNLLDSLSNKISSKSQLEIYNGVAGVGLGIIWLYQKDVISGNLDSILKNIDDYIYKKTIIAINTYEQKYENTYLDILLYIAIRFKYCKNQDDKEVFSKLWFSLYNKLYFNLTPDFFIEPIPSIIKYKIAQFILISGLGVKLDSRFQIRISKIFKEISNYVFSYCPQLNFNRLVLFASLKQIGTIVNNDEKWIHYQNQLFKSISIKEIIENEILPNDMYLTHGLPCLYFLIKQLGISLTKDLVGMIIDKLKASDFVKFDYENLIKFNYTGLDGILGAISMLIELKPELLYEEN